ncbi:hypothetical protein NPA31_009190 [Aurantimonas sp. MSK8Z-1]|uniref:hypothetical protein n=1 Tax=Mangrovibrevibacter kandeliae TaxID=2968473 RepID=UPI002117F92B|nr:hypothetical protein [Aurantimonas sp. MSK8Z-1]MCW4115130.1 hypothetical protein [Aurantimonas sp. MSK8Z-1]
MTPDDILVVIDEDLSDDPIFTAEIRTPAGTISVMGRFVVSGRSLEVADMHIGGDPSLDWGWGRLRHIARLIAEKLDVDEIIVAGAVRTTGANPGRSPGRYRIARTARPAKSRGRTP